MLKKYFKPWRFIMPGLILGLITLGVPIYQALKNSFYDIRLYRLGSEFFVGFDNYINLWNDSIFLLAVRVTLIFTIGCTILSIFFGLSVASVLSSDKIRGSLVARFFMAFFIVPFVATQVVTGVMGRLFIWDAEFGLINYLLNTIGLQAQAWLTSPNLALPAAIITNSWRLTPLALLVLYAALATIPETLIESAKIDGANEIMIFLKIKLPMIKYHIIFVSMILMTSAFREFDVIYSLTGRGPRRATNVLSLMVYEQGVSVADMGYANAIAFTMFLIVAVVTVIFIKIFKLGDVGVS